uniref:Coiled-coil domain containing 15 n=1 Tax=Lepisosteus oculatus TaxID=7918 RepID=W5M2I7_LEPOC|nr:PREDICTED: coiled-coil domain-containing protein 15 [Lepisosteus oculatus]
MSPAEKRASGPVRASVHSRKSENQPASMRPKALRLVVNQKVLAERNQAVMPVGAWVEIGQDYQEHPAIQAVLLEEMLSEVSREKTESLRRFQAEVRRRVAQQAQARKRRQLQKSYEVAEHEGRVVQQSCDAAQRLTPRKNMCTSDHQGELAICGPGSRWVSAQGLGAGDTDSGAFQQQEHQLGKVLKQVRRRLASCQTISAGKLTSELPGGIWRVSPTRDKPVSCLLPPAGEGEEEPEEEVPLSGQHDLPLGLEEAGPPEGHSGKTVTFQSQQLCERMLREPYPTGPSPGFSTDYRATQVLWPREDQEELKRQRQSQFLMYRRLFMDMEREQVKEQRRHREHLQRIARIKADKERQRREEERRMERLTEPEGEGRDPTERECEVLERLRLEEEEAHEEKERREKAQKDREVTRFMEALRAQMSEKMKLEKAELPPLCCCGDGFWDTHPDTCANNCVFYRNPRAYARALQSVLSCCDLWEANPGQRASARRIASAQTQPPRK